MGKRLERLTPERLSAPQRTTYLAITGGPRSDGPQGFRLTDHAGTLHGPFNAMLLSPRLGFALQELGSAVRYETSLSGRVREAAVLAVATFHTCAFERYAHEGTGAQAGLTTDEITALRQAAPNGILRDSQENLALRVVVALLHERDLDDGLYTEATEVLGEAALFELSTLVGYYSLLALQMRVFRVQPPTGRAATNW
ncbi:carboxymuconolactone decarboxylase family protein [Streptomyces sp. NPDC048445]|uniref:carboxymuconolactone decarboxylase family protein n=1 Tax=Streptomyces sp. NPDC048445 TaxID=3365553 RepID=UPI003722AF3F